jgi:hypothetical protein
MSPIAWARAAPQRCRWDPPRRRRAHHVRLARGPARCECSRQCRRRQLGEKCQAREWRQVRTGVGRIVEDEVGDESTLRNEGLMSIKHAPTAFAYRVRVSTTERVRLSRRTACAGMRHRRLGRSASVHIGAGVFARACTVFATGEREHDTGGRWRWRRQVVRRQVFGTEVGYGRRKKMSTATQTVYQITCGTAPSWRLAARRCFALYTFT